jgi:hypothetical protein
MENVGILHNPLEYFTAAWYMYVFHGRLVQFVGIWYIFPLLVCFDNKNLATLFVISSALLVL